MSDFMELLAPGGNPSSALAALDAGADAVYCGLQKFNARERSENFTHEELSRLIAYAHRNRKKVYVTFNTLLKESELKEAAAELARLALMRPDALIVQDPGAARMIRNYFPDLTLHASTQMGFHNSAGLAFARDFGFQRVILERQVTLQEIRAMRKSVPDVELELFVHGALCCCLSGSCLFSSFLGGWSGNRGKCKQPCRRLYYKNGDMDHSRGEFLFSPDDLCALELIRDFRQEGVCSLKIEGRLRRADYVSKVVRAYRTVLDASDNEYDAALKEAQEILRSVNTRKYSLGFYAESSMKKLVRLDPVGGSGRPCGEVERSVPGGFEALMHGRLHVGDTIRVQKDADSSDSFNATVLYMEKDFRKVMKVLAGERCFIRCDKKALRGSLIYRTGESSMDYTARLEKLPSPKRLLDLKISLSGTELKVEAASQTFVRPLELQKAQKRPLDIETLKSEFSSSASEIYDAGRIEAEIRGEWFLPSSVLKDLRREFYAWAETSLDKDYRKKQILESLRGFRDEYAKLSALPLPEVAGDYTAPGNEFILDPFIPEGRLASYREKLLSLIRQGVKVFRLTHLSQFALFPEDVRKGLTLKTMYPLPVCNSQSVLVCREAGAEVCQAFVELGENDCEELLAHSAAALEYYAYGRPGIFTTRALLPYWKRFSDVKENFFRMEKEGELTVVYPDAVLLRETPEGYSTFRDLRHALSSEENTTLFNAGREWA